MAKLNGHKITIAMVVGAIAITLGVSTLWDRLWGQAARHVAKSAQVTQTEKSVAEMKPRIKDLETSDADQNIEINSLTIKQEAIYKGVEDIQATQKIMLERMP